MLLYYLFFVYSNSIFLKLSEIMDAAHDLDAGQHVMKQIKHPDVVDFVEDQDFVKHLTEKFADEVKQDVFPSEKFFNLAIDTTEKIFGQLGETFHNAVALMLANKVLENTSGKNTEGKKGSLLPKTSAHHAINFLDHLSCESDQHEDAKISYIQALTMEMERKPLTLILQSIEQLGKRAGRSNEELQTLIMFSYLGTGNNTNIAEYAHHFKKFVRSAGKTGVEKVAQILDCTTSDIINEAKHIGSKTTFQLEPYVQIHEKRVTLREEYQQLQLKTFLALLLDIIEDEEEDMTDQFEKLYAVKCELEKYEATHDLEEYFDKEFLNYARGLNTHEWQLFGYLKTGSEQMKPIISFLREHHRDKDFEDQFKLCYRGRVLSYLLSIVDEKFHTLRDKLITPHAIALQENLLQEQEAAPIV